MRLRKFQYLELDCSITYVIMMRNLFLPVIKNFEKQTVSQPELHISHNQVNISDEVIT